MGRSLLGCARMLFQGYLFAGIVFGLGLALFGHPWGLLVVIVCVILLVTPATAWILEQIAEHPKVWITGFVIVFMMGGFIPSLFLIGNYWDPETPVNKFCGALSGSGSDTYTDDFSSDFHNKVTPDDFISTMRWLSCVSHNPMDSQHEVNIGFHVNFADMNADTSFSINAVLVQETLGKWKIDHFDTASCSGGYLDNCRQLSFPSSP